MTQVRFKPNKLENEKKILTAYYKGKFDENQTLEAINKIYSNEGKQYEAVPDKERIQEIDEEYKVAIEEVSSKLRPLKAELKELLKNYNGGIRTLNPECLNRKKAKISIFESMLVRVPSLEINKLTDAIIIVRVYFFEVFHNLVVDGFLFNGNKYVCLTASAGQIRTKKCVFIREDIFEQYNKTLMCGLTIDKINELGGCNTNKFLAYLALCSSATDEWTDFDIDKTIVVDDMETCVRGMVDYIDNITYEITRQEMDVPITHTDGCGMILPHLSSGRNFMVRMPWVKGLLGAFAFDEFIREFKGDPIVKDIYGREHNVLAEGIQVIFTKSQFKMWKYYDSWEQYKAYFKRYNCSAGICNMEENHICNATLNYQILQTLCDLSDGELNDLALATNNKLKTLGEKRATKLKVLGATENNEEKTAAQECLLLYPELLQDSYFREELKNMQESVEKWAWCGKLDVYGKYLFALPDLFAFCQHLFLGKNNPSGLLRNGEVYASLFGDSDKLDCLRSPHLYREHPVRKNIAYDSVCQKWFTERAIYTSCHDLISKVLMFDE
jgi:hypothetical protein